MKLMDGISFPVENLGSCSKFEGNGDNIIVAINLSSSSLLKYNLETCDVEQKSLSPGAFLSDITNGPLSGVCPASRLIGIAMVPKTSIVEMDPNARYPNVKKTLKNSTRITLYQSLGTIYAIQGFVAGDQKFWKNKH